MKEVVKPLNSKLVLTFAALIIATGNSAGKHCGVNKVELLGNVYPKSFPKAANQVRMSVKSWFILEIVTGVLLKKTELQAFDIIVELFIKSYNGLTGFKVVP